MNEYTFLENRKVNPIKWFCKLLGAGALAFAVLSVFSYIYYNPGTHITSTNGATDYVWESNGFYSKATEGFAYGRVDKNGYNNAYPAPADEKVDMLLLGSSHMEAFNVASDENTVYVLNELLRKNGDERYVYNIGMSEHNLIRVVSNFSKALEAFKPSDYAIVELASLDFTAEQVLAACNGELAELSSYDSGLMYNLQKFPLLKLLRFQISGKMENAFVPLLSQFESKEITAKAATDEVFIPLSDEEVAQFEEAYEVMLKQLLSTCEANDCELILIYHPNMVINNDGSIRITDLDQKKAAFFGKCEELNIATINMTETFLNEYKEHYIFPNGFYNTGVGAGHLNKHGHRMLAQSLFDMICELEAKKGE